MSWHTPFDSRRYFERMQVVTEQYLDGKQPLSLASSELARLVVEWLDAIDGEESAIPERFVRLRQGNWTLGLLDLRPGLTESEAPRVKQLFDAAVELIPGFADGAV